MIILTKIILDHQQQKLNFKNVNVLQEISFYINIIGGKLMFSKVEIEFDHRMNLSLIITCPMCNHTNRRKLYELQQNTELKCTCGHVLKVNGDDLRNVTRSVSDLKSSVNSLGKHL